MSAYLFSLYIFHRMRPSVFLHCARAERAPALFHFICLRHAVRLYQKIDTILNKKHLY